MGSFRFSIGNRRVSFWRWFSLPFFFNDPWVRFAFFELGLLAYLGSFRIFVCQLAKRALGSFRHFSSIFHQGVGRTDPLTPSFGLLSPSCIASRFPNFLAKNDPHNDVAGSLLDPILAAIMPDKYGAFLIFGDNKGEINR